MELVRNALSPVCEQEGTSLADYNLYVLEGADGKDCNAAAFGKNNILVSRGALIELTIPQLSGILAHEAGHIYNGDTRVSVLLACMGFFGELAVNLLNISVKICGWLMWIPIANIMLALYTWAVAIVITLINYVINIPAILVTLLFPGTTNIMPTATPVNSVSQRNCMTDCPISQRMKSRPVSTAASGLRIL